MGSIQVEGLSHSYRRKRQILPVLRDVELVVDAGAYVSFAGPSGSGKTTLFALLGGLERPQSGTVIVAGHNLRTLSGDGLAAFRSATLGFVFQHYGLLESLTAAENVEVALGYGGVAGDARHRRAVDALDRVGLSARLDHRPYELSGGERQRVAIARAIVNGPQLILADEPTGNLDEESAGAVVTLLEALRDERGCTLLVVTHNKALASRAYLQLALADGRLVPAGAGLRWAVPEAPGAA